MSQRGRPPLHLDVTPEQLETLRAWRQANEELPSLAIRADIVLLSAEGLSSASIAERLVCGHELVAKWRHKWRAEGLGILSPRPRQGRSALRTVDEVRNLLRTVLVSGPRATQISTREGARLLNVSQPTAYRTFRRLGLVTRRAPPLAGMSFFSQRQPTLLALDVSPRLLLLALAQQDVPWPLLAAQSPPMEDAPPEQQGALVVERWAARLAGVVKAARAVRSGPGLRGQPPQVTLHRVLRHLPRLSATCGRVHLITYGELPSTPELNEALRGGLLVVHPLRGERQWQTRCARLLSQPGWRSLGEPNLAPLSTFARALDDLTLAPAVGSGGFTWLARLGRSVQARRGP